MAQPALAAGECDNPPAPVRAYLQAHPGWVLHTPEDLEDPRFPTWHQQQGNTCPGWVRADLDGKGAVYALAISPRAKADERQKIVIVGRSGWENLLQAANTSGRYLAVTRMPPDKYEDRSTHKTITLAHDGIAVVVWEAAATGYYLADGKLRSFLASE